MFDALQALLIGLGGPTSAVIVALITRRPIKKIENQVQNSHSTNLRDDIDGLGKKMDTVITEQKRERSERELMTLQAEVEHRKIWSAIRPDKPVPVTSETEIINLKREKQREDDR